MPELKSQTSVGLDAARHGAPEPPLYGATSDADVAPLPAAVASRSMCPRRQCAEVWRGRDPN